MQITLTRLTDLSDDGRTVVGNAIGNVDGPSWVFTSGADLIRVYIHRAPLTSFSVLADKALVGVFSVGPDLRHNLYLIPRHQGRGIAEVLSAAAAEAAYPTQSDADPRLVKQLRGSLLAAGFATGQELPTAA